MPLEAGQILQDRYRIDALLGAGGMGAVYRATDLRFGTAVAVKENLGTTAQSHSQFEREAQALHELRHSSLPRVTDHFELPGVGQYLVMDYVEGHDLSEIYRQGPVPEQRALAWIEQVLDALEYLHGQQPPVIHRDVKPANVKVTADGRVYLVDFGLVKRAEPNGTTKTGALGGTPGFAPPEQYGGQSPGSHTDARTDIYSTGATLYTLLTGERPPDANLRAAGAQTLEPPGRVNENVSPHVEAAILRAMALQTTDRFLTAAAFRTALKDPGGMQAADALAATVVAPGVTDDLATLPSAEAMMVTKAEAATGPGAAAASDPFAQTTGPGATAASDTSAVTAGPTPVPPPRRAQQMVPVWLLVAVVVALALVAIVLGFQVLHGPEEPPASSPVAQQPAETEGPGSGGAMDGGLSTPPAPPLGSPTQGPAVTPSPSPSGVQAPDSTSAPGVVTPPGVSTATHTPTETPTETPTTTPTPAARLLFASTRGNNAVSLHIVDPSGVHLLALATDRKDTIHASWSPDNRQIAFVQADDNRSDIYLMDADGGNVRPLVTGPQHDRHPQWMPDGQSIIFYSDRDGGDNHEIYAVDVASGAVTRLTHWQGEDDTAFPSPDGRYIAFNSERTGDKEVIIMEEDGDNKTNVSGHPGKPDVVLDWSPDGRFLLYRRGNKEEAELVKVDVEQAMAGAGSRAGTHLTNDRDYDGWARFSPSGTEIAFVSAPEYDDDGPQGGHIYLMDANGGGVQRLTERGMTPAHLAWSPDGRQIAYDSGPDNRREIYLLDVATGTITNLTNDPADDYLPVWSR